MRAYSILLFASLTWTAYAAGPYFFVACPNVFRFGHGETLVIGIAKVSQADVTVRLEVPLGDETRTILTRTVTVRQEIGNFKMGRNFTQNTPVAVPLFVANVQTSYIINAPTQMEVTVRPEDIVSEEDIDKPTSVFVVASTNFGERREEILLSYDTGYIFVQTNKPLYKPRDDVTIRTLALTEKLQAATDVDLIVDVLDPSGLLMQREKRPGNETFFKWTFKMPPNARLGVWTISASYGGEYTSEKTTTFQVDEYVLPTFGVDVTVEPTYILDGPDDEVRVQVDANYVYGKKVQGTVFIELYCIGGDEDRVFIFKKEKKHLDNGRGIYVFQKDEMRPNFGNDWFPVGRYLQVIATVTEEATGNQEKGTSESTVFAEHPFKFDFSQSIGYYTIDSVYYLKVLVTDAAGKPVPDQPIEASCDGVFHKDNMRTDEHGFKSIFFQLGAVHKTLEIKVYTLGRTVESPPFQVQPYRSPNGNRIHVEVDTDHGGRFLQARSNSKADQSTGLFYLVTARGKPVSYTYRSVSGETIYRPENLEQASPSARCTVFYIDTTTNEVVADSIKIPVEKRCRGDGLTLSTKEMHVTPGKTTPLDVHGSRWMAVGLKALDQAVLLLNDKNILQQHSMYRALGSHDLGCGEGGGSDSASVFENAGITLLTNANMENKKRASISCDHDKKRRKRSEERLANDKCYDLGSNLATYLIDQSLDFGGYDVKSLRIKCIWEAVSIIKNHSLPMRCGRALYHTCLEEVNFHFRDVGQERSEGDDESDYMADLAAAKLGLKQSLSVRSRFKESWLFETLNLDAEGNGKVNLPFPHSITDWMITAIGISQDHGLCIAEPVNVTAYKDFFIQLDLPYSATRMELINVKATIFNYGEPTDDDKTISVYLEGEPDICSNAKPGKESPRKTIVLGPNSAGTVRFPIIPMRAGSPTTDGQFNIKVTAIDMSSGRGVYDIIEKKLHVKNEGIKEEIDIHVCLDPAESAEDCGSDPQRTSAEFPVLADKKVQITTVDLTLPADAIPGTAYASAYMTGNNVLDLVVHTLLGGVETLFNKPYGCGEQNAIRLAPTVYALRYLKQTGQVTPEIETEGNKNVRAGIAHQRGYRKDDGSYAVRLYHTSSTWLTAFVMKMYCQAEATVSGSVTADHDLNPGLRWLAAQQNVDGSFTESKRVYHREMIGQLSEADHSLPAFVLITILECRDRSAMLEETVQKSLQYIRNLDHTRLPLYQLAILTYALSLARVGEMYMFNDELIQRAVNDNGQLYWNHRGAGKASANAIETTSYALLAQIEMSDFTSSAKIVKWLVQQRDSGGAFVTTQDTVVGLQALSEYSMRTKAAKVDLEVRVSAPGMQEKVTTLHSKDALVPKHIPKIPVTNNSTMTVRVAGTGAGRMNIALHYNRKADKNEICTFDVTVPITTRLHRNDIALAQASGRKCDACGECEADNDPNFDYGGIDNVLIGEEDEFEFEAGSRFDDSEKRRRKRESENDVDNEKIFCLKFDVGAKGPNEYGMSIIEVGLQTGVSVKQEDLQKLQDEEIIDNYEMPTTGKGFVVMYVDTFVVGEPRHFSLRLYDAHDDEDSMRQSAVITVYDYYNPERRCTQYYGIGLEQGQPLDLKCDKRNRQCACLQRICSKDVQGKVQKKNAPALYMFKHLCLRADYGIIVTVTSLYVDDEGYRHAAAIVNNVLKKGIQQNLAVGDEIDFHWTSVCSWPNFEENTKYVVLAPDGPTMKGDDGETIYSYPLMNSAWVMKRQQKTLKMKNALNVLVRKMKLRGGCKA